MQGPPTSPSGVGNDAPPDSPEEARLWAGMRESRPTGVFVGAGDRRKRG